MRNNPLNFIQLEGLDAPKIWSARERCIGKFVILQKFFLCLVMLMYCVKIYV